MNRDYIVISIPAPPDLPMLGQRFHGVVGRQLYNSLMRITDIAGKQRAIKISADCSSRPRRRAGVRSGSRDGWGGVGRRLHNNSSLGPFYDLLQTVAIHSLPPNLSPSAVSATPGRSPASARKRARTSASGACLRSSRPTLATFRRTTSTLQLPDARHGHCWGRFLNFYHGRNSSSPPQSLCERRPTTP